MKNRCYVGYDMDVICDVKISVKFNYCLKYFKNCFIAPLNLYRMEHSIQGIYEI